MRNLSKGAWPKMAVRKWLNMRSAADEAHSDYSTAGSETEKIDRRESYLDKDYYVIVPGDFSEELLMEATPGNGLKQTKLEEETPPVNLRMFVGTWNVGGKSPHGDLNLSDWLTSQASADIYVLGFQEIVPLNAGNVLGAEDKGPATKWLSLIRTTLNSHNKRDRELPLCPCSEPQQQSRMRFSDLLSLDYEPRARDCSPKTEERYCLVASKQMVGIFLCVWVRADLCECISNLKVSCVGCGIMGYLGNKGSISISMTLHQTTFCFVCTHLSSGDREGDEVRRNSDVEEILRRTRFTRSFKRPEQVLVPPQSIMEHDNIIWLGDLNYRLVSNCEDTHELLLKSDWQALLENDQLRMEQRAGRVFKGWKEGKIAFAPTYKYVTDSDRYDVQTSKPREKCRMPAWCDRILWKGEDLKQVYYVRGESRFSDHRQVSSLFWIQVDLNNKGNNYSSPCPMTRSSANTVKVQAEELLIVPSTRSCIGTVQ